MLSKHAIATHIFFYYGKPAMYVKLAIWPKKKKCLEYIQQFRLDFDLGPFVEVILEG